MPPEKSRSRSRTPRAKKRKTSLKKAKSRTKGRTPRPAVFPLEHNRALFETMSLGVVYQDREGRIIAANPAAERILGLTLAQMLGRSSMDLRWKTIREDGSPLPGNEHPSVIALRTGKPVRDVLIGVYHPKKTAHRWLLVNAVPQFKPRGIKPNQVYTTFSDITELKRAEGDLRRISGRQEAVLSAVPDIIAEVNAAKVYTWMNEAGLEFFGNDCIGREAAYYFEHEQSTYTAVQPLFNGSEDVIYVESWQRRKDGEKRLLAWWCRALKDGQGNVTGALSTGRDITEQKRAEEALRESENRWHLSIDHMLEGYALHEAIFDENGRMSDYRFLEFNPAARKIANVAREDIVGRTALALYPHLVERGLLDRYADVMATGEPAYFEDFYYAGDNLDKALDISCYRIDDRHFVCVFRDITDRKRAEQIIREERDRAQSYLDIAGVIIVVLAPDGTTSLINQKGCEVLGCRPQDIVGKSWIDLCIAEQDRPAVWQAFRLLTGGDVTPIEYYESSLLTFDGRQRLVAWHNALLRDSSGRVVGTLSSGEDITDRRLAEAEREQLLNELAAKNKEMESLVYVASHDLRSPLVNILGFSSEMEHSAKTLTAILQRAALPPEVREEAAPYLNEHIPTALHYIRASGQKMDALIEGLLRLSRTGRAALNPRRLDMNAMATRIVASMSYQAQQASASIRIEPLPDCTADEPQINQVFSNLLDNALKYRDPARPLAISISGRVEGKRVIYCVEDTGVGIAGAHQSQIWELFHRLAPAGPAAGEGLGLTLVRRIVERHGGRVWLDSEPGRGSRFYVELPVAPQ